MSRSITATNLRTDLREILLDLDAGPVEITKHGKVVAVLSRPIPADLLESSDPAVVCTTSDDAPAGAVEQHADEMRSRGALAVDASDGSQEPSGEPVEASEGVDTSEPVSASQDATEAEEPNDFTEEDDRDLEAEFDAWLAAGQPDDEIGEPAAW
jgi:antitoxin (DNA-binding transcriptional repressor) of toxin-antitoxin stability system